MRAVLASAALGAPGLLLSGCGGPQGAASPVLRRPNGCPAGFDFREGQPPHGGFWVASSSVADCAQACSRQPECWAFEFSQEEESRCIVSKRFEHAQTGGSGFCVKSREQHLEANEDAAEGFHEPLVPPYPPSELVEQKGAAFEAGSKIGLYAIGSSNVLWMTWIDQLHLLLARIGYQLPPVPAETAAQFYPTSVQRCDDEVYFKNLKTARMGRIGWNSWDFAFDDWTDCHADGFRDVDGHRVKCEHGEGCAHGRLPLLRLSDIAADAAKSDVTLVTSWFNDNKQFQTHFSCFGGERLLRKNVSLVAVPILRRTIKAIHAKNPDTWVVVLGKYPPTENLAIVDNTLQWLRELNAAIKAGVEKEPRTIFVDYVLPGRGLELYQKATVHYGHPNCRGSKLMAYSIVNRLFETKVLARSLRLMTPPNKYADISNCEDLEAAMCHTSVMCWKDPQDDKCKPYSAGSEHFHLHPGIPRWAPGQHLHS